MIQDKIFFDEKDPTGLSYNTPFTYYGSYQGRLWSKSPSGSIQYYTQNSDLSAYATTGSNQFSGSQTVTGSLTVTGTITGTVAGTTSTASYVEYTNVANKPALISGSAQIASFGIFATTGSNGFNGSQSITGSLTVTGQVVAQTLNVQQVTSSIVYSSGSNIFGNSLSNTQQFTGSMSVTGSLTVNGAGTFSSTVTAINGTFINGSNQNTLGSGTLGLLTYAGYNSSANQNITLGLAIDEAVDNSRAYQYNLGVTGNATGQNLVLTSKRRGTTDLTILTINGTGGAATFGSSVTATQYTATSTGGSGLRVYGASGTNQWDMYLNGANIRFSDNTGGGRFVVDSPATLSTTLFSSTSIYQVSIKSTGTQYLLVGSENASSAGIILDGDSNGDGTGGDYSYIVHDSSGVLHIVQDSPSGTNEIRFGTAGTENKVVINSSGNIGVGMSSPINGGGDAKWITLEGNSYSGGFISSVGGTAKGYLYYDNGTSNFIMQAPASTGVGFWTANTERMRINSDGNLRINNFTLNGLVGTSSSGTLGAVNLNYTEIATGTISYSMNSGAPWAINNSFPATIRNYEDDGMAGSGGVATNLNLNRGVTFDLGSAKAVRRIVERGYSTKNLDVIIVQYSTDNSNWTDIYVYNHIYGNTQKDMQFNPTGAISARYWRWFIHSWTEREVQNYYTYEAIIYT